MRKSLHLFGLGASRLLPEAAIRFGGVLRRGPRARDRKKELLGSVSRRLFFETLEPRLLLSADLRVHFRTRRACHNWELLLPKVDMGYGKFTRARRALSKGVTTTIGATMSLRRSFYVV